MHLPNPLQLWDKLQHAKRLRNDSVHARLPSSSHLLRASIGGDGNDRNMGANLARPLKFTDLAGAGEAVHHGCICHVSIFAITGKSREGLTHLDIHQHDIQVLPSTRIIPSPEMRLSDSVQSLMAVVRYCDMVASPCQLF